MLTQLSQGFICGFSIYFLQIWTIISSAYSQMSMPLIYTSAQFKNFFSLIIYLMKRIIILENFDWNVIQCFCNALRSIDVDVYHELQFGTPCPHQGKNTESALVCLSLSLKQIKCPFMACWAVGSRRRFSNSPFGHCTVGQHTCVCVRVGWWVLLRATGFGSNQTDAD